MTLVLFQVILQTISTTLQWVGFYSGVRGSTDQSSRRWAWITGSAAIFAAWLIGIVLPASGDFFSNDVLPPRIPLALAMTLAFGYLMLLSGTFRSSIAAVPQHWLIGIQAFRVIRVLLLVQYFQGDRRFPMRGDSR